MLRILNSGVETLVEDWPGRLGYLGKGMAPSGAMDNVALQFANLLVGNAPGEAGLEITGGYFEIEFTEETLIAITGTDMAPVLSNEEPIRLWEAFMIDKGEVIKFGHFGEFGFRSYMGIAGGINVPRYLGSKSTCIFGNYGGYKGRKLQNGDELDVGTPKYNIKDYVGRKIKEEVIPEYTREWKIRALPGPNVSPDYVTKKGMDFLFEHSFKVQHTSNRSAYRLDEVPEDFFARKDGGVGGSHPSNIVDHAYAMPGALNICGNTPVLLVADGPTLGGYMCSLSVINADLWKIGQATPSRDFIKFEYCTQEEAVEARKKRREIFSQDSIV